MTAKWPLMDRFWAPELAKPTKTRLHTFEEMRHAAEGWLSVGSENMTVHIDMQVRRTAPFPPDIRARIAAVANAHAAVPWPDGIVRKVVMPVKS
jgi:acyl-CoA thioester hydrolase